MLTGKRKGSNFTVTLVIGGDAPRELSFAMPAISAGPRRVGMTQTENKRETEKEYLVELNAYWETLSEKEQEKLYELYEDAYEVSNDKDLWREHLPGIMSQIVDMHPIERIEKLYPRDSIWYPDDMKNDFGAVCTNYSEDMTYVRRDYYDLIIFGIALRALVPVFCAVGAVNTTTRGRSTEETVHIVHRTESAYNMLMGTALANCKAMEKLDSYLTEAIVRIEKENKKTQRGAAPITLIAIFVGLGTESLDAYIRAYAIVGIICNAILNPISNTAQARVASLACVIYRGVKTEVCMKLAKKLSSNSFREKVAPNKLKMFGEESKISAVDGVRGRSAAPIKVAVQAEVAIMDYRTTIKHLNPTLVPSEVKVYIDSMYSNRPQYTHIIHEWLTAAIMKKVIHRKTLPDFQPKSMAMAMAIAQAELVNQGYQSLAVFLSCTQVPKAIEYRFDYPMDALTKEMKDKLDECYPAGFMDRNKTYQNPAIVNISEFAESWVNMNTHILKCDDETLRRLRIPQENLKEVVVDGVTQLQYTPQKGLRNDLAEFLHRSARRQMNAGIISNKTYK